MLKSLINRAGLICLVFVSIAWLSSLPVTQSSALQVQYRSLTLLSTIPSVTTNYTFSFTLPDVSVVGSIEFEFCESGIISVPCVQPPGINASGTILQQQSGETGFNIALANSNEILLSRTPAGTSAEAVQYVFSGIVNPSTVGQSFYGRILTYATDDGSGAYTDYGATVSSINQTVNVTTQVPPLLDFCVGQTVAVNCSSSSGDFIDFGNLSSSSTETAISQMSVATNALSGLAIVVSGATLASGNNVINSPNTPTYSTKGSSQFGLNLRANSSPDIGQDPTGPGDASPSPNYDQPNKFLFNDGNIVASDPTVSDYRLFTASYIVNVSTSQPPGVYETSLNYICTASF